MNVRHHGLAWVLTTFFFSSGLVAQLHGGKPPESAFFETLDVTLINVEVFVTDKKGNPISGLHREDFELYQDGRPVAITNFYAVESGRPSPPKQAPEPVLESASPEKAAAAPFAPLPQIPEDQRLYLVVYIDNFNIQPLNRNRIFGQLRQFLNSKLGPEDRVMLVSYDRSVHIRHRFTKDEVAIAQALSELEKLSGHATQADRERRRMRKAIRDAESPGGISERVRQHAASVSNDLRFTLDALRDMISSLAGLPGRKAFLYVSDGLPMTPAQDLFFAVQRKFGDMSVLAYARDYDASRRFQQLSALANTNRVTFYTIDATGLQFYASGQAETGRTSRVDALDSFVDSVATENLQAPIRYIAERTGGTAIFNTNDIGPGLDRVATDFHSYYSLGFPATGDQRYHKIEVKVKQKGYVVRHREGYRAKPAAARMVDGTISSLRYGYQRNPLDITLQLGRATPHEKGTFEVPISVQIPLASVLLVPRETMREARVTVFFTAMDAKGEVSDVRQAVVPINIPNEDIESALEQYYSYKASLLMRAGKHVVAVGVRDELGANSSFVTKSIQVGSG